MKAKPERQQKLRHSYSVKSLSAGLRNIFFKSYEGLATALLNQTDLILHAALMLYGYVY